MSRLLFLDIVAPQPDRHASSVRSAQLIELLVERGIAVDFASVHPPEREQAVLLRNLGATPLPWCDDDARRAFLAARARDYDTILVAWTAVARRFIQAARQAAPAAYIVFDTHDVNHVREYREARAHGNQNTLRRALRTRAEETAAMRAADRTLAITEADAATLRTLAPGARVAVVTMWWEAAARAAFPRSPPPTLLYVGHYGSSPNHDAALQLGQEILPRVHARRAEARLVLAGSDPSEPITALAGPAVEVPGWMPDLAPLHMNASVFVAPLRYGSGLKGKMLQAMAYALPIVASAVAAEGIGLRDGHDFLEANAPEATADAVLRVLDDPPLARRLGDNARDLLIKRYGRAAVAAQLAAALER